MPIYVNGEQVPEELISQELSRIRNSPEWHTISNSALRALRIQEVAETYAIDRVLLKQESEKDCAPVDPGLVEQELEKIRIWQGAFPGKTAPVIAFAVMHE